MQQRPYKSTDTKCDLSEITLLLCWQCNDSPGSIGNFSNEGVLRITITATEGVLKTDLAEFFQIMFFSLWCQYPLKHYAKKAYGGVDVYIHVFLTSAPAGGEWSASLPCVFTPGKEPLVPIG
jgi:hypothetical protein